MSSFLTSILSSIGNEQAVRQSPTTSAIKTPSKTVQQLRVVPSASGDRGKLVEYGVLRKREGEMGLSVDRAKRPRLEQSGASERLTTIKSSTTASNGKSQFASRPELLPYRDHASAILSSPAPRAQTQPLAVGSNSTVAAVPPKKGSYQEILARAKAAQYSVQSIGVIKHKPVEKISKKERERREAEAAVKAKQSPGKGPQNGKIRSALVTGRTLERPVKERKRPVELSYKGTMRPASTAPSATYKGTMGLSTAPRPPLQKVVSRPPDRSRGGSAPTTSFAHRPREAKARYAGYASYSENDSEDEDEEQEYDRESDELSDMEAKGSELEEEEMQSLRAAKKEDEEAARLEDELKRAKAERKRKLTQMAASAKPRKF